MPSLRRPGQIFALVFLLSGLLARPSSAQLERKLDELDRALAGVYDGQPVTLDECLDVAEVGALSLGRLEEDLESARIDKRAALAQWLPDLSINASWQRQERTDLDQDVLTPQQFPVVFLDSAGNPLPLVIGGEQAFTLGRVPTGQTEDVTIHQTFESQSISTSWTLFSGFDRIAENRQAKASLAAAEANLEYQRDLLRETVTNAYYELVRAGERVEVAKDAERLAAQELERSETYFDLGISTKSDVLQAKVRHQQTKLDVVRERNAERNAFLALAHAMNIPGGRRFEIAGTLPEVHEGDAPELDALIEEARMQRLDLTAARYNLDASGQGVTRARSGYYPGIEIFGSWSRSVSETPFRFGAQENTAVSWGVRGNWNVFDRFRTKQNVRRAVATQRKAEYDLRKAELDMELEIVNIHNNLVEAIESHALSEVSVEQSEEDLRLAEERFRVGAGTSLDVITAQVNLAQARRDLVDAKVNFAKALAQLERAVGRPVTIAGR